MAIASLLHRLSGVALFLLFPLILYIFSLSAQGPAGFSQLSNLMQGFLLKGSLFIFAAALIYHFIAGIRHLLMDMGYGDSLIVGRLSSIFVIGFSLILIILLGIRLW